ncbi:alpha/beta hydrolase [Herbiconiux liukaitaii]|uniref:alpha/beta hydrolase n=1 Tax=Herbiconiux liukaitaii TaxID=3342799 RepID=UPI0035B810F5
MTETVMDPTPMAFFAGVAYCERAGEALRLDVLAPARGVGDGLLPVAVFFHGGGWHEGDRGAGMHPWMNPLLATRGYVTVSVTYRLSKRAAWPAQFDDARDAVGWVVENIASFGGDPARVGVWGFSAGAHIAAHLALRLPGVVKAASLAACPADLRETEVAEADEVRWLLGAAAAGAGAGAGSGAGAGIGAEASAEALAEASPITWVTAGAAPTLIVHGTDDQIVDFAQGVALRDALQEVGGPVEFVAIPGGSHEWADKPSAADAGGATRVGPGAQAQAQTEADPDARGDFGSVTAEFFDRVL